MTLRICTVFLLALTLATGASAGQAPAFRFAIPAGELGSVIPAFEAVTQATVAFPAVDIRMITSPGVAGTFTADEALQRLLNGTSIGAKATGPRRYQLEIRAAAERVEVVGTAAPYRSRLTSTATKTETPLRDVPQTVTVVPSEVLADQNAQSLGAAMKNVPGVTVAQGEGNRDQIVIRGTSTASDFFVNGLRDDQERFRDLYNVERIEVVQGPAAVLFGRGGAGGVVNIVTKRPSRGVAPEVTVDIGSFDHKRATAQVAGGLGAATFGLSLMAEDSESFRDEFFLKRYGVNPTVGVALTPRTNVVAGVEHLYDRRLADRGIPSQGGRPAVVDPGRLFGSPAQNIARSSNDALFVEVEHRFSNAAVLRNRLLSGRYDKFYQNVYPGSAVTTSGTLSLSAYNNEIDRTNTFNQTDLIYTLSTGVVSHTLLAGVEIGHQAQDEARHTAAAIGGVTVDSPMRDANFASAPLSVARAARANVAAVYLQDQAAFGRHWRAVIGARTDRFSVGVDDHLPANVDLARTDVATSPRAGLIFQPNDAVSVYTSYSYTFLPSGQTLGLAVNTAGLAPENAKNYEVGTKLDLIARRLNVAAALFRLDRNNVKRTDPNDPTKLVLTGQQRTQGVTLSVSGSPLMRWQVYGGYSNLDAEVTRATSAAPAGRTVGLVPRSQVSLWSTYDVTPRVGAGGGIVSQSRMFTSFTNQVELPGYSRVDAVIYYRGPKYRLALNVENLFDTAYFPTANGDNNISPGAPRTLQLTLRTTF